MNSPLRGATLYLDCFAGMAGDMTLAALFDLGVPEAVVRGALSRLKLPSHELRISQVVKGSLSAKKVDVIEHASSDGLSHAHAHQHDESHEHEHPHHPDDHHHHHDHPHVHYRDIRALIADSDLDAGTIDRALLIFDRLAKVEAAMHGVPVADVAFHEVGALDSIVDIVAVAAAITYLSPRRIVCRPVPLGRGMVKTAHGRLPVPAPATLALLTERGAPIDGDPNGPACELTTPTGAAIIAALVEDFGPLPTMRLLGTGLGAGTRDLADRPNVLRVIAGVEPITAPPPSVCVVIEANIDNMNPELYEPVMDALFATGVRDVWMQPVYMKKARPGVVLSVLCDPGQRDAVTQVLFRETTTLGVRWYQVDRTVQLREILSVETALGAVEVKIGRDGNGAVWNVAPEYASCLELAKERGVPVKQVYAAAIASYWAGVGALAKTSE